MDISKCWYKDVCTQTCCNSCVRFIVMDNLCELAHLPMKLRFPCDLYPNSDDYEAFTQLSEFKNNVLTHINNGDNLYIYSSCCGNGKTTWSAKILMKYFDSIWHKAGISCKALFIHTPAFLIQCKEHFRKNDIEFDEKVQLMKKVPLIVWDDVTFPNLTDFERELFLDILDTRFNNGLSNIFTGNLSEETLSQMVDKRIFSRIWNYSTKIKFTGEDKRGDGQW